MAATIRDIKNKTGLSLATISKYLNGGNVLPENKMKIEAAIKELHYEVNEIARGLVTNKTMTVGILVYSIESPFAGLILHHVGEALKKNGYGMLICDSCNDEETESKNLKYLLSRKVDGIIAIPVSTSAEFLKPAKDQNVPVALLDRTLSDSNYDCVRIDNRAAAMRAMNELIGRNHKKIAIIASEREYTGRERYKGFLEAMNDNGLEIVDDFVKLGVHSIQFGYQSMKEIIELAEWPTAVFMSNYEITLGAMMAVNEYQVKCPDDISLLGFDDQILFHVLNPKMYMVAQPMKKMGEKVVEVLVGRMLNGNNEPPMDILLSTTITEGNSVKTLE